MVDEIEEWRPGSFTKNFGWGENSDGLIQLWTAIRVGFDGQAIDTPRTVFRKRLEALKLSDYIPLNFFLFNSIEANKDMLLSDELVFQAINFKHSRRFDKLAIFAFNLSLIGRWKGAEPYQRRPAEWARNYVVDRISTGFNWDSSKVTANDIEKYVSNDKRYKAKTTRKLATNYHFLLNKGRINEFNTTQVESWWLDALDLNGHVCLILRCLNLDRYMQNTEKMGV